MNRKEVKKRIKKQVLNHYGFIPDSLLKKYHSIAEGVTIEVKAGCNLSCPVCPTNVLKRQKGNMRFSTFKKIVDELPPLKYMQLFFMGESMLNPDVFDMISYAEFQGYKTHMVTNSTTLHKQYQSVVDSGLSYLTACLDGFTNESLNKYRIGSDVQKIKEGIKKVYEYRDGRSHVFGDSVTRDKPVITIKTVLFDWVKPELNDITNFAREYADHFRIDEPIVEGWGDGLELDASSERTSVNRERPNPPCWRCMTPVITWDGELIVCCMDEEATHSYGNILEESFDDLFWRKGKELRKEAIECNLDICKGCQIPNLKDQRMIF